MRFYSFVYKSLLSVIFIIGFFAASGQDAKYYCTKGDEFYRNNEYAQAINQYAVAINLDPNYIHAYQWRGSAYIAINETDLAIQDFNTCISLQPGNKFAWANRGYAYARKNQFYLAIEDYSEAIRLDPQYAWAYANRGFAYAQLNYPELAIRDLSVSLYYDPNNAITYSNRYHAYFKVHEPDSALMDITKAISLSPTTPGYYNNRGYFYNTYGAYELSVQDYQTCLSIDPNYSVAYINIISPLVRLHRLQEARSYYDQYRQKRFTTYLETPKYKFYNHFITAVAQVLSGKLEDAWNSLDMASQEYGTEIKEETKRSYVDILFLYGYILEQLGEVTEATSLYEQSLVIDANQPDLEEAMVRLQKKQADAVTADKTPPVISLKNPAPSSNIDIVAENTKTTIVGSAKDISGIAEVKINGILIDKVEEDGLFIANIPLKAGANYLVISATDKQGNTSNQTFTVNGVSTENRGLKPEKPSPTAPITSGPAPKFYAILIAAKDYDDDAIPDLKNPVKDARELKSILESRYTFSADNIDTLFNRSREEIMQAIVQRCNSLTENDNLVIFYAGHGIAEKDKFGDVDGYWIPSSAKKGLNASYISADDINKAIKRSNAKHILLIADACFSGAFTRELPPDASKEIKKQYAVTSRKVMASGNLEPVPDNSKFIFYLKKSLIDNSEKFVSAKELFDGFYKAILSNSDNLPQYAAIKNTGDEGGEFIFIKK